MTTRRQLLAAAAAALPLGLAHGQGARKPWRIGYVGAGLPPPITPERLKSSSSLGGLLAGFRELGLTEGADFVMEWRFTGSALYEGIDQLAADLVRAKVDVIIVSNPNGTRAAQKATSAIPIIFYGGTGDPVAAGFVKSLARPGGNITGFSNRSDDILPKQVDLLRTVVPKLARLAVLVNPVNPAHPGFVEAIRKAARSINLTVLPAPVTDPARLESALADVLKQGAQALLVLGDVTFLLSRRQILALVQRHRLPAVYINQEFVRDGGLMQYGWDALEDAKRVALYVRKILQEGAKPADLPVEQSNTVVLVVNRKAAQEIGVTLPQEILLRANEVIE